MNQKFKELYTMKEDIVIDESLMKYKGRYSVCNFINYVNQNWVYYDFKIYIDSDKINSSDNAFENVVKDYSQYYIKK